MPHAILPLWIKGWNTTQHMRLTDMQTEKQWADQIAGLLTKHLAKSASGLVVDTGFRLAYGCEIVQYNDNQPVTEPKTYQTDILIREMIGDKSWIPRLVIETKLRGGTTHDAITYSQKAANHKFVHPYLRYGLLVGNRHQGSLPGRLYRHGSNFDFMLTWTDFIPKPKAMKRFVELVISEVNTSRSLQKLIFESRKSKKSKYSLLQRSLLLE